MKTEALKALNAVSEEQMSIKELAKAINLGYRMTTNIVRDLLQQGYLVKSDGKLSLASTALATAFRKVSKRYDTVKVFGESREKILLTLLDPNTIQDIQSRTKLSYRTIRRALNILLETSAIRESEKIYALAGDSELRFFLTTLREEQQSRFVEPYAEVVYTSSDIILKRVPLGKAAKGFLTAFSVFGKYGVELRPIYQCFVQPEKEPAIEELLVHAIVFSRNPVELTDCAVFYAKNKEVMDLGRIREIARKFAVNDLVMDLENYVRNLTISSPRKFLPWDEFAEKARLYGVSPESLLPPSAFPDFFKELAKNAGEKLKLHIFGGEAMRIRGLKRATKDVDIVVENERTLASLRAALTALGYRALAGEISKTDMKLNPSGIFIKQDYPRIDVFVGLICNAFNLSDSMMNRCELREMGNLKLCIMSNEDIFLLKSVTDREGDIYDMIDLAKSPGFNWRIVFEELHVQEETTGRHFCRALLDSIEIVEKRTGIKPSFHNKLVNHCIDQAILESVGKWKATTLRELKELVDYPDYKLRSRVSSLIRCGKLLMKNGKFAIPQL